MRGRKPKLKIIEGGRNYSRAPRAPGWLTYEAQAEWKRIVPALVRRKILADTDLSILEHYCFCIGAVRRAQAQITREGDTIETRTGGMIRHPMYATLTSMLLESRRLAGELGLTPASRTKAEHAPIGEGLGEDDLADLGIRDGEHRARVGIRRQPHS